MATARRNTVGFIPDHADCFISDHAAGGNLLEDPHLDREFLLSIYPAILCSTANTMGRNLEGQMIRVSGKLRGASRCLQSGFPDCVSKAYASQNRLGKSLLVCSHIPASMKDLWASNQAKLFV